MATRRLAFSGEVCAETAVRARVEPRSAKRFRLERALTRTEHPATELLMAAADGLRAFWYFARDSGLHYPQPDFGANLEKTSGGYVLNVTTQTFAGDLCLLVDKLESGASTDTQLLTLLPGKTGAFEVATAGSLRLEDCLRPDVLMSANMFGASAERA